MPIEDHAALDEALDAYISTVHEVTSVMGLKAPDVDFGAEIDKINSAKAEVDSKLAELRGDVPAVEVAAAADAVDPVTGGAEAGAAGDAAGGGEQTEPAPDAEPAGDAAAGGQDSPTA